MTSENYTRLGNQLAELVRESINLDHDRTFRVGTSQQRADTNSRLKREYALLINRITEASEQKGGE